MDLFMTLTGSLRHSEQEYCITYSDIVFYLHYLTYFTLAK